MGEAEIELWKIPPNEIGQRIKTEVQTKYKDKPYTKSNGGPGNYVLTYSRMMINDEDFSTEEVLSEDDFIVEEPKTSKKRKATTTKRAKKEVDIQKLLESYDKETLIQIFSKLISIDSTVETKIRENLLKQTMENNKHI
eukprot:gene11791-5128_t